MKDHLIDYLPPRIILGRQTETGVNAVRIDCSAWLEKWPELELSVWVTPPGGNAAYPAVTHMEGTVLVWPITSSDTAHKGFGSAEIMGTADGLKKLSAIAETLIQHTSIEATSDPPTPAQPWVDAVMDAAKRAEEAADRAENAGGSGGGGSGGVTQETDPTVPAWAKEPSKPTYTAEEVGAQPKGDYALKSEIPEPYTLPTASAEVKGGVKVGEGLQMDGETVRVRGYKLLATYNFEEYAAGMRIDEIDGYPVNLKALMMICDRLGDDESENKNGNVYILCKGNDGSTQEVKGGYFTMASKQGNCWMVSVEIDGDTLRAGSAATTPGSNSQIRNGHTNGLSQELFWQNLSASVLPLKSICGFYFTVNNSITPGTRMWVYGKEW